MKYLDTKEDSIEDSVIRVLMGEAAHENGNGNGNGKKKKLDPVNKDAVKKDFDDRKDKDIDNDGDVDSTDKYLHKRRKAISKAVKGDEKVDESMAALQKKLDKLYGPKITKDIAMMMRDKKYKGRTSAFDAAVKKKYPKEYDTNAVQDLIRKHAEMNEAMSGRDVAKRMMKIQTMKAFANKVAKMKTVSRDDLEKMLPDYIDGADITKVLKEKVDLGEGYEGEVMKILDDAGIDGYFKMGKLYVSKRDAKDAKKALEDADNITKLPPMVKEEKMTKTLKDTIVGMWQESAKDKDEGNAFGAALQAAKEKGEDTFMVAGKKYDVKTEKLVGGQKKLDKDKDGDIDAKDFAMLRKQKKEEVEFKRYHETKQGSLRDAVLQMWGENVKKESKKDLTKSEKHDTKKMTDTGKDVTPVDMSPKMPKIKNEKNRV